MPPLFSCKTTAPELYAEEMKKLARAEQSRVNGAKSHGPTSPEGKFKCSRGALKHGLTARKHAVLDIEDSAEFAAVRAAAVDEFRPVTAFALRLVEQLAQIDWRIDRLSMLETAYLNHQVKEGATFKKDALSIAAEGKDEIAALLRAWIDSAGPAGPLELMRRYTATLQHQFNATFASLQKIEARQSVRSRNPEFHPDFQPPYRTPEYPPAETPAQPEPPREKAPPQPSTTSRNEIVPSAPPAQPIVLDSNRNEDPEIVPSDEGDTTK